MTVKTEFKNVCHTTCRKHVYTYLLLQFCDEDNY